MARIRGYFINLDPKLKNYFVTAYTDVPTKYVSNAGFGMRRIAQIIEGFLFGLIFTILLTFTQLPPELIILIGLGIFFLIYLILEVNAHRKLKAALLKVKQNNGKNYAD